MPPRITGTPSTKRSTNFDLSAALARAFFAVVRVRICTHVCMSSSRGVDEDEFPMATKKTNKVTRVVRQR